MKCPVCNKEMIMGKVVNTWTGTVGWYCPDCKVVCRNRTHPDIIKGVLMAKEVEGKHAIQEDITRLPALVQIGILRARQHPEHNYVDDEHVGRE